MSTCRALRALRASLECPYKVAGSSPAEWMKLFLFFLFPPSYLPFDSTFRATLRLLGSAAYQSTLTMAFHAKGSWVLKAETRWGRTWNLIIDEEQKKRALIKIKTQTSPARILLGIANELSDSSLKASIINRLISNTQKQNKRVMFKLYNIFSNFNKAHAWKCLEIINVSNFRFRWEFEHPSFFNMDIFGIKNLGRRFSYRETIFN